MARANLYPPSIKPGIPTLGKKPNGWLETTFGAVLKPVYRKAKLIADQEYQLVIAKRNRGGVVPRSILNGSEIKTPTQFYIRENDFLIARRQIIHGACGVVPADLDGAIVSNEYSALLVKDGLLLEYLKYFCHTIYFQQTCFQSSVGVDVEKMIFKIDHWFKWPIYLPPVPEQRKIAEILSTWDEAIAASQRLLSALRERKKGLMQRLLTGQVRFAGFAGEWREMELRTFAKIGSGNSFPERFQGGQTGDFPFYKVSDMNADGNDKYLSIANNYVTQALVTQQGWNVFSEGTIVFPKVGATIHTNKKRVLRTSSLVDNNVMTVSVVDTTSCYPEYLYYWFLPLNLSTLCRPGAVPSLSTNDMGKLRILLPERKEQTKIADVLKSCDEEIELHNRKLAALQAQKKGLMQRLLTGQVRVKV